MTTSGASIHITKPVLGRVIVKGVHWFVDSSVGIFRRHRPIDKRIDSEAEKNIFF